jgi:hypothetical protein
MAPNPRADKRSPVFGTSRYCMGVLSWLTSLFVVKIMVVMYDYSMADTVHTFKPMKTE